MQAFTRLKSVAAPMPDADIDTDIIFPARFLVLTQKAGLGPYAFYEKRFDPQGRERPDFVLHRPRWRGAAILVAGANFGCGSSREQAPWALADLGLRCLIAPGFGEIFQANCLNNGLLPISLPPAVHARVMAAAESGQALTVDLTLNTITLPDGEVIAFAMPAAARLALLEGRDAIERIRQHAGAAITAFEARQRLRQPWLHARIDDSEPC
ncbi:3-isopropylmalate dehydratase small subunit [Aquabacterium sp. OR-4]|uniref:3-isopropylmalate dehydratase small subunit n=1 Tax=Aquabacterium sp. OR-4 TaxID=2978127 RepID=UPI0021B487D9|nr:3-isopropylmalate dehydratase small subunit [Aquabacterium sp. OR-4]MDT7836971.1 3-isopropylmalate dehydratase small subunit [Aquabacterium sp. OR-4]